MRWRFAARTEITRGPDQTLAEVMQPDAVDHDTRGERILVACDGLGQFQSPAAVCKRFPVVASQNLQKLTWHFLAFVRRIAPHENARVTLCLAVSQDHRIRRRGRLDDPAI